MPIEMGALKGLITPHRTVLVLGAGASIPSGAPSGAQLAELLWRTVGNVDPNSADLLETTTILERRYGRRAVVDQIRLSLLKLRPKGGLQAIPSFEWRDIYTTNFDKLVEDAYKDSKIDITPIRSNYDLTFRESRVGPSLYKIHGCVTQDRALGDKPSMLLTEADYEEFGKYRQTLFSSLTDSLLTCDALIIGHSLRDPHLQELIKKILSARNEGAPGRIFVLVYQKDDFRAPLLEDRGAVVVFGGIDDLIYNIAAKEGNTRSERLHDDNQPLSPELIANTACLNDNDSSQSNAKRMFNGGPASVADIRQGITFERSCFLRVVTSALSDGLSTTILGPAGVGKTTLARQIGAHLADQKSQIVWEHKNDFPFKFEPWVQVEHKLREAGTRGILILDECTRFLRQAGQLIEYLDTLTHSSLHVILIANSALWAPRIKSPKIFTRGTQVELSKLDDAEIGSLLNILERNVSISNFVSRDFKSQSRRKQHERLRIRCSADMFVCLANIFASESLDTILLQEFDDLEESAQDYYRHVAALEAVGTRVHRQLILRLNKLPASNVPSILLSLTGIVDEYDIRPERGIYGWATRHLVIARKITEYKYSGASELISLFENIIENINPAEPLELQSIRDICDVDYGIGRIGIAEERVKLYRKLTVIAPAERIPWHRLIREMLNSEQIEETEFAIRDAAAAAGTDGPIDRYKVRLLQLRAEVTKGISEEDRRALLRKAHERANVNVNKHKNDKQGFRLLCNVALDLVNKGDSEHILKEAIDKAKSAYDRILDPDMLQWIKGFDEKYYRLR